MRIVVLVKPVPDPAAGGERLRPDWRLDRSASPAVVNANDEYALEAALKLVEQHGGEVSLVTMAGPAAPETIRKALAMGAAGGRLVSDRRARRLRCRVDDARPGGERCAASRPT